VIVDNYPLESINDLNWGGIAIAQLLGKTIWQLEEQGKYFLNNQNKNKFDLKTKTAHLSRYFDWYKDDFGKNDEEVVKSIKENPELWTIEYIPYFLCGLVG
jgi:hypothetical protein